MGLTKEGLEDPDCCGECGFPLEEDEDGREVCQNEDCIVYQERHDGD
jgi:hypothetical protein